MTSKQTLAADASAALLTAGVKLLAETPQVHYRFEQVGDVNMFYREAGKASDPAVLLIHGYAASSYMWRDVIAGLADSYHVVAIDLPAFGFTESPSQSTYQYTFANLAKTVEQFTRQLKLEKYALVVHDYGAPVAWRLAVAKPLSVTAIISQNGNAYVEGLAEGWTPIQKYWREPTKANRESLREFVTPESIKWQYTEGVSDMSKLSPDGYTLAGAQVLGEGLENIQLDLLLDYASNIEQYPQYQEYFRKFQPPLLAVWGANDPFFLPAGAKAWERDIPNADIRFYDTGHFALETHANKIVPVIREFLSKHVKGTSKK